MNDQKFWNSLSSELVVWIVAVAAALALTALLAVNLGAIEAGLIFAALLFVFVVALARLFQRRTFY